MVKKEKVVKQYTRKSKSGKTVVVRQHTAKYDAAEALKEAAKKKGAGDELDALKKKKVDETLSAEELREVEYPLKDIDAVAKALGLTQREAASWLAGTDFSGYRKADMKKGDKAAKKYLGDDVFSKLDPTDADVPLAVLAKLGRKLGGSKFMRVRDLVNASKGAKTEKAPKKTKVSKDATDPYSSHGFTKDEFKEWYEGTGSKADKKVEKALKKAMGTKAYNAFSDKAADEYKKGGAHRFFTKGLEEMKASTSASTKLVTPSKETKEESLKVGSSVQMGNSLNLGKGKKETFKVLAVQKTNKQDRELGNTEAAWIQRKNGSVTLALKDSEKGWMYDDTWTDFTDRKHPYAKSLEAAGYSFKKAQGKGGKYWEVSKGKETKTDSSKSSSEGGKQSFVVTGLRMDPTNYNERRTLKFDPATGEVHGRWSSGGEKRLTRFLNAGNRTKVANAIEKKFGAEARKKFFEAAGVEDKPKKVLTKAEQRVKKQKEDAAYARKMRAKGYVPIEGPLGKGWAKKEKGLSGLSKRSVERRVSAEAKLREWKKKQGIDDRYIPETDTNPKRREQYYRKVVGLSEAEAAARSAKVTKQQAAEKRRAGKQKIAQLKEKGYALVRTGATGNYYAKKGSRTVYNPDGTKAMPSQAEYALAKLAGRKPRRLK